MILLRILLIASSLFLLLHVIRSVTKARVRIDDIIFWVLFAIVLIVLAIVPQVASFFAEVLHFQAPINLVYLVVIFLLILRVFNMSIKVSQLEMKMQQMVQDEAVKSCMGREDAAGEDAQASEEGGKE